MKLGSFLAPVLVVGSAALCSAVDAVVKFDKSRATGTVKSMTANEVTLEDQGKTQTVPANEIDFIQYGDEPADMNLTRSALRADNTKGALDFLGKMKLDAARKEIKQDFEFYVAYAQARMALRSGDPAQVAQYGPPMFAFYTNQKDSYHFYPAAEMIGDLLVLKGDLAEAKKYYGELESSSINDFKMRGGLAVGKALINTAEAQSDAAAKTAGYNEARQAFERVLAVPMPPGAAGARAKTFRYAATLGKAQCQAAAGEFDAAIKDLNENVIAGLGAEETELQALAYVTLGNCYKNQAGNDKLALLAYLHVDMLYATASCHAEALWNMAYMFKKLQQDERSNECMQRLRDEYPGSPWTTKKWAT